MNQTYFKWYEFDVNFVRILNIHCNVHMYADGVQLYTRTPRKNIYSYLDYINRDLVKID